MIDVNAPDRVAEVTDLVDRYEEALMANDVAQLDAMFWESPHAIRLGVGENLYGFDEIAAFRLARPGGSPPRERLRTTITTFGPDLAVANVEFRRVGAARIGRQSQVWVRTDAGWRIASAHVSLMAETS